MSFMPAAEEAKGILLTLALCFKMHVGNVHWSCLQMPACIEKCMLNVLEEQASAKVNTPGL